MKALLACAPEMSFQPCEVNELPPERFGVVPEAARIVCTYVRLSMGKKDCRYWVQEER